ncbi:MAG: hypothetical protein KJZ78_22290 [Bryobacteraceae bacterium]|nr:hypothetical protein [Bryobacteraceae bacterium]
MMRLNRRNALAALLAGPPAVARQTATPHQVPFGSYRVSRLMVGGNPVSGNSHVSAGMSREMLEYFTAANVKKLLHACEQAGVNTWQSRGDRHILRLLSEYRQEGGRIHWIAQTASELVDIPRNIRDCAAAGAIGVYHHGSQTDRYWASGKIEQARETLKVMRDAGVRVGLGTHIPEVIDYVEDKGWDVDFYMTCLYNLARSKEELARLAGGATGELFLDADRERMLERVRRTPKQCLLFKVYGASRKCGSRAQMLDALALAARYAKPSDCFVIGMFPKYSEQVRENCELLAAALGAARS